MAAPPNGQMSWPPMLSICRESRGEAIRYYEGLLGHLDQFDLKADGERAKKKVVVSQKGDRWQEKQRRQATS